MGKYDGISICNEPLNHTCVDKELADPQREKFEQDPEVCCPPLTVHGLEKLVDGCVLFGE